MRKLQLETQYVQTSTGLKTPQETFNKKKNSLVHKTKLAQMNNTVRTPSRYDRVMRIAITRSYFCRSCINKVPEVLLILCKRKHQLFRIYGG